MFKHTTTVLLIILVVVSIALTACGGGSAQPAAAVGNAENGKKLFNEPMIASAGAPGCATCHSLEVDKTLVGPTLATIGHEADEAVKEDDYKGKAKTGAEWLRESIVDPNVDVAEGFKPDIMPKTYNKLSTQELNDLVAYLQTLK